MPEMEAATAEAFSRRYFRRVYNFCRSLLREEADVEDACQEVFLTVMRRREELSSVERPACWLMKIARLTCLYVRRKRARGLAVDVEPEAGDGGDVGPPIDRTEDVGRVREAATRLPERYQTVLTLHFQQGMAHEEIADVLGISRGAVRVLLHRAVARLREEVRVG